MDYKEATLRKYLKEYYEEQKKLDSSFSVRKFAEFLDVDHSYLSKALNGKSKITEKLIEKAAVMLDFPTANYSNLKFREYSEIPDMEHEVISSWEYYALLKLLSLKDIEHNPELFANKLNISLEKVKRALKVLEVLGYIESQGDRYKRVHKSYYRTNEKYSQLESNYKLHRGVWDLADRAFMENPEESAHTLSTLAISPRKLKYALDFILNFSVELGDFLSDEDDNEIYFFSCQLVPAKESEKNND